MGCSYSVLSLGDSSYEFFCQTGKDFDLRLEELGGKRFCPRTDCDLDYDEPAAKWFESVISSLNELLTGPGCTAQSRIHNRIRLAEPIRIFKEKSVLMRKC